MGWCPNGRRQPRPVRPVAWWTLPVLAALGAGLAGPGPAASGAELLRFETAAGTLDVYPVGHGSLYVLFGGLVIHVDPYSRVADYSALPKADQIWITHSHPDHLDLAAIQAVEKDTTIFVTDATSATRLGSRRVVVLRNGETTEQQGVSIEAVPAYNLVQERAPGQKYHPRGEGNGYVATFGGFRVYIAGDTECIPEMGRLGRVDVAFLPINLPFTMPPEEAVGCIKVIAPRTVVPYHQGDSDPAVVARALQNSGIEVLVFRLP